MFDSRISRGAFGLKPLFLHAHFQAQSSMPKAGIKQKIIVCSRALLYFKRRAAQKFASPQKEEVGTYDVGSQKTRKNTMENTNVEESDGELF